MTGIICATETEMKAIINEIKNILNNYYIMKWK